MHICHGRRRCTISADRKTFGDPCRRDSRVYLKVVYTCSKSPNPIKYLIKNIKVSLIGFSFLITFYFVQFPERCWKNSTITQRNQTKRIKSIRKTTTIYMMKINSIGNRRQIHRRQNYKENWPHRKYPHRWSHRAAIVHQCDPGIAINLKVSGFGTRHFLKCRNYLILTFRIQWISSSY